jgi:hypothetical protein
MVSQMKTRRASGCAAQISSVARRAKMMPEAV